MSDEADACECIWSHEFAMQRLLAFIRQNQNECTDTYCLDGVNSVLQAGPARMRDDSSSGNFTMMIMLMMAALLMYLIRPQVFLSFGKNKSTGNRGGRGGGHSTSGQPPPPPPAPPAIN